VRAGTRVALCLLALAGCAAPPAGRPSVTFLPDAQGLAVADSGLRIDFGRAPSGVIPVVTREMGQPRTLSLDTCPPDIVQHLRWGDLELTFEAEAFVGWRSPVGQAGRTCA